MSNCATANLFSQSDRFSGGPLAVNSSLPGTSEADFLGNITKSPDHVPVDLQNKRLERWAMHSAAGDLLPSERVSKCLSGISIHKHPNPSRMDNFYDLDYFRHVEILKSKDNFHYGNLMTCGSVWHCPICAAKISEQRRSELTQAVANWKKQEGSNVLLLTLTIPHYSNQKLKPVLDGLSGALDRMTDSRAWKSLKDEIGLYGRIRSLEVTYGQNGWHPHFHLLLFVYRPVDLVELQARILTLWKSAAARAGLPEPNHHGVKVDNGDLAAKYVGKWGLEHEMTKGHIKKSNKGASPFDLLRVYLGIDLPSSHLNGHAAEAGRLFKEYAKEFKGKRQLMWSRNLKNDLLIDLADVSDQEAADQVDDDAVVFARIPSKIWKIVLKRRLRGVLLEISSKGKSVLDDYLQSLLTDRSIPGVHRDPHVLRTKNESK